MAGTCPTHGSYSGNSCTFCWKAKSSTDGLSPYLTRPTNMNVNTNAVGSSSSCRPGEEEEEEEVVFFTS